jgi:hypothetical protein
MATKKKTAVKAKSAPALLKVEKIVKTDSLKFRAGTRRGSMYDTIYADMRKLKEGQSFTVPVPKDVKIGTLQNRLNAAIGRGPVRAPAGCVFRKYTTEEGKIAIACEKLKPGEDNRFKLQGEVKAKTKATKKAAPKAKKVVKAANSLRQQSRLPR